MERQTNECGRIFWMMSWPIVDMGCHSDQGVLSPKPGRFVSILVNQSRSLDNLEDQHNDCWRAAPWGILSGAHLQRATCLRLVSFTLISSKSSRVFIFHESWFTFGLNLSCTQKVSLNGRIAPTSPTAGCEFTVDSRLRQRCCDWNSPGSLQTGNGCQQLALRRLRRLHI